MSDPKTTACPRCGAPIPARAADQLCPACLLTGALGDAEEPEAPPEGFPRQFGGYRLLGLLGRGGMGTVYEAEQITTARRLALKVLATGLDSDEMRQRFLREGRLAASVNHPNSLYVFGTEEIDGHPAITMEIAAGGTLMGRLAKHGTLPVSEAVDAMLDVILGLEAHSGSGVLHRDVKPSNCFVTSGGSVKIGDFGLSVSTRAHDDSTLTRDGSGMGTPAFASPEQLRGGELDLRADIYSVGATMYALLAGKPPIEGRNAIEVVAAVLEEAPRPITELREDVPRELAQVVAKCLAKKPEHRYPDYETLRRALLPFGSSHPEPAPIGHRLFAGFIDVAICGILPAVAAHAALGVDIDDNTLFTERSTTQVVAWLGLCTWFVVYFTVFEGIFRAGLGKALMGLRVRRLDGRSQGPGRAFVRGFLFILGSNLGKAICFLLMTSGQYEAGGATLVAISGPLIGVLPFVTIRRRNGWATLWDLATGTRVVTRAQSSARPSNAVASPTNQNPSSSIGPYAVHGEIAPSRWLTAQDPALDRPVWLVRRIEALDSVRREVARPGRNRWLQSIESKGTTWDVFAAPHGTPLADLISEQGRLPWDRLRHWLHDLASEIASAEKDGTLPAQLGIDHVWITSEGRAVLLDEEWPQLDRPTATVEVHDLAGRQRFVQLVAAHVDPVTIPLYARPVLQSLAAGSFERMTFLLGSLRSLLDKPGRLDPRVRAVSLFALPSVLVAAVSMIVINAPLEDLPAVTDDGLPRFWLALVLTLFAVGACSALPQLVALSAFGVTPGQLVFGIAAVDTNGEPAGRVRLLARWYLAWSLPIAVFLLCTMIGKAESVLPPIAALVLAALWVFGLAVAVARPSQGLHDRWSGCWLVPR